MDCRDARDRLASWLDGELAPAEAELLEMHLDACPACRDLAERLSAQAPVLELVRPAPDRNLEREGWWDRMDAALAEEMARRERADRGRRRVLAVAARRVAVPLPVLGALVLLAAAAAAWGWSARREAARARDEAMRAGLALERVERLAAPAPAAVRGASLSGGGRPTRRGQL